MGEKNVYLACCSRLTAFWYRAIASSRLSNTWEKACRQSTSASSRRTTKVAAQLADLSRVPAKSSRKDRSSRKRRHATKRMLYLCRYASLTRIRRMFTVYTDLRASRCSIMDLYHAPCCITHATAAVDRLLRTGLPPFVRPL